MRLMLAVERKRRKWSLAKVCQLTGIDPANITRMERGLVPAFPGWKKRISEAFGVPAEVLFAPAPEEATDMAVASNA